MSKHDFRVCLACVSGLSFEIVPAKMNLTSQTTILMKTFIEDYLQNPAQAIANAQKSSNESSWADTIDEELIYSQIASPEFSLYQSIVL